MRTDNCCGLCVRGMIGRACLMAALLVMCVGTASAQRAVAGRGRANADGSVTLPYSAADGNGGRWMVYQGGNIQMQGNMPIWGQAAMLTVNGSGANSNSNTGTLDPKTGELVLSDMKFGQCTVQRRVLFPKDGSFLRIVDVFKNTTNQAQTVTANLQSNINYGAQSSSNVTDPRHPENTLGVTAMTGANRAAVEVFSGSGAKVVPSVTNMIQNQNMLQASIQMTIQPGKTAAWMHLLESSGSEEQGRQDALNIKVSALTKGLPPEVRRAIVNFPGATDFVGDYELLRDPNFDVVELRTGDQMRGTLKETSFKLTTFYGTIDVPADQVIGLLNVGQFRPRQLVVTQDGQVFGGTLSKNTIDLQLSSGQTVSVPLSQLTRAGYHKRPNEPEEWTADKPYILMRQGDRINIEMPKTTIEVMTRYGTLKVDPATIQSIQFQSDETGVHLITLTDGTKFAGLVTSPELELKLGGGVAADPVKVPTSAIVLVALVTKPDDDASNAAASLSLVNQDQLVGTLSGQLKLDTSFDTLALDGGQIRKISHVSEGSPDVTVMMWDDSAVSGQLESPSIACKLKSGLTIDVPLALLDQYSNSSPSPSDAMVQKVKDTVTKLAADDFKDRDAAQEALTAMGPVIAGELQDLRPSQPPEAQQRIDAILRLFSTEKKPGATGAGAGEPLPINGPVPMPFMMQQGAMQVPLNMAD